MKSNLLANFVSSPFISTLTMVIVLGLATAAQSATNVVTSLADSGAGSLRQAIANAAPGDTILFNVTGTIGLSSILPLGKDISILGPGASVLTISGNGSTRLFGVSSGASVLISGMTLRDGKAPDGASATASSLAGPGGSGGAITNTGFLTLWNCVLTNNRAGSGGSGIYPNTPGGAGGAGGAIYTLGNLSASNCVFTANLSGSGGTGSLSDYSGGWGGTGGDGGAICGLGAEGTVLLINSSVLSNSCGFGGAGAAAERMTGTSGPGGSGGRGGGIYAIRGLTLIACTVAGNSAGLGGRGGGGFYGWPGSGGAGGSGGGIYTAGLLRMTNCTAGNNQCGDGGGGGGAPGCAPGGLGGSGGAVCCSSSVTDIAVVSCTIVSNSVGLAGRACDGAFTYPNGSGAGICLSNLAASGGFLNSIIALGVWRTQDVAGVFISLGHNLIGATNGSSWFTAGGDLVGSASSPLDPLLGPLANNGGPTLTMALLPGSPAIDAGSTLGAPITDQRGFARPCGPAADIGAYECGAPAPPQLKWTNNNGAITITGYIGTNAAVTIPGTINDLPVTSIGDHAFQYCSTLHSIDIGDSVTSIGTLAFQYCSSLTNVTIGQGLNTIGTFAFLGCSNLTSVYCEGNAPSIGSGAFGLDNNATIYFLGGATGWGSAIRGRPTALWVMPTILTPPRTQTAEAGSLVRLQVRADGDPAVGFAWNFNGTNGLSVTNRILLLTNVQPADAGAYTVVAANAGASATSAPGLLSVIPPVPRRPVPAVTLSGSIGTALNLDSHDALESSATWTNFDTVSLTSTSQWYFDVRTALAPAGFYRSWTTDSLNPPSPLVLHMVSAITLTGAIGNSVRLDAINQMGPTDAWWTLDTVTLTNTSQLYFDTSSIGQPPRLWRIVPLP